MSTRTTSVVICTYMRPDLLDRLLQRLQEVEGREEILEIVVVDNDPAQSAGTVLERWSNKSHVPLISMKVPTPNISLARNACVQASSGEWIAMIDDDEIPDTAWLSALLKTQRDFGADIVHGPVLPILPPSTPAWIREGGFFEHPRHVSGTPLSLNDLRTGNVLVRRSILLDITGPFDPAFGRTGGGDTALLTHLLARGARGYWSDEAVVREIVPTTRATRAWITQRAFRTGQATVHIGLVKMAWPNVLYSTRRACLDPLRCLSLTPFSMAKAMQRWCSAAFHMGRLTAFAGLRYEEYRH